MLIDESYSASSRSVGTCVQTYVQIIFLVTDANATVIHEKIEIHLPPHAVTYTQFLPL